MHNIIFLIVTPIVFAFWGVLALILRLLLLPFPNSYLVTLKIAEYWGRCVLWLGKIKVEISGMENIKETPRIFASNHQGMFDIVLAQAYLPPFHFVVKESLFKIPLFGLAMHAAGYFPINRTKPEAAKRTMNNIVRKIVEKKASILIYPEGTRSLDGQLQPFKRGCAKIAHASGATVYPIGIQNTWKIAQKGSLVIKPQTVSFKVGEGIKFEKLPMDQITTQLLNESTQKIKDAVAKLI